MEKQNNKKKPEESLESDVRSTFGSINEKFMSDPVYVYDKAVDLYLSGFVSGASDFLSKGTSSNSHSPSLSLQGVIAYVQKDYQSAFLSFKNVVDLNSSATLDAYFAGASLFNQHNILAFDYFKLVNENGHFTGMKRISNVPMSVYPEIKHDLIEFFDYIDSLSALRIQNVSEFGKRTRMILTAKEKFPHNSAIQQIPSTLELDVPPMDVFLNRKPVRDSSKNKIVFSEVGNKDTYSNPPSPKKPSSSHIPFVHEPGSRRPTIKFSKRSKAFRNVVGVISGIALPIANVAFLGPVMLIPIYNNYVSSPPLWTASFAEKGSWLVDVAGNGMLYGGINGFATHLTMYLALAFASRASLNEKFSNSSYNVLPFVSSTIAGLVGGWVGGSIAGPGGVLLGSYTTSLTSWLYETFKSSSKR